MNNYFKTLLKLSAIILSSIVISNAHAVSVDFVAELGAHFGGDNLQTVRVQTGNRIETEKINAGELVSLQGGAHINLNESSYIRTLIGWKGANITGSNGEIEFTRVPIDAMYFYKTKQWHLGAGLTYHLNPKLTGQINNQANTANRDFENSLGYVFEADFMLGRFFYLGAKYTSIDYKPKLSTFDTASGNSFGIVMGFIMAK